MLREISVLVKLNLCNIYGFNVFKNNKDKKAKAVYIALASVMLLLVVMVAIYIGLMVYGYVTLGIGEVIPSYLIMIASLIILCFGIFKAGPVLFERKGYDTLCSLPISTESIVIARFIRMYVENMILTLTVMVPGIIVYGLMMNSAIWFYLAGAIVILLVPFAPMTISVVLGAVFSMISSRTRYKSVVGTILPVLVVVGSIAITGNLSITEGQITPEMLTNLAEMVTGIISKIYPPAIWLGKMMLGTGIVEAIVFLSITFAVFSLTVSIVGKNLQEICQRIYGTVAKHDFVMREQSQSKIIVALVKKEFKRYMASTVYLSNTIMGPILAVVFAASLLFVDIEEAVMMLPIEIDVVGIMPLAIGTTFCIMNTTSTSISMEGKEWWLIKSLPLTTKQILDGKLLMNLMVFGPFYAISVILMIFALKPMGIDLLWVIVSPGILILFSCVWGLFVNLKIPVFNWENETSIVKQSMSSLVGGLLSALVGIVLIFGLIIAPPDFSWTIKIITMIVLMVATKVLYNKNNKVNLEVL